MALEKITDAQMDANGVIAAPDVLNGSPAANKAIFDRMVRNIVAPAYNACVDAVNALQALESGLNEGETKRVNAELARAQAELERAAAELSRETAERAREDAEVKRENKETGYVAEAKNAATEAKSWAVGSTGTRDGEDTDNAKYYAEQAKQAAGGDFVPNSEKGQPRGVATLDINGKVPEGQIPELNYAPAGFGLGTTAVVPKDYDANNAVAAGWYQCKVNTPTDTWWDIFVPAGYPNGEIVHQFAFDRYEAHSKYGNCYLMRSKGANSGWGAWEWVNPPMALGVEYRTTERYLDRPVYTKAVSGGSYVQNGTFSFSSSDVKELVRRYGTAGIFAAPVIESNSLSNDYTNYFNVFVESGDIKVRMAGGTAGRGAVSMTAFYTKSTD